MKLYISEDIIQDLFFYKKKHPEMYSQKALCNVLTWQKTYLNETFFSSFRFLDKKNCKFP